MAAQPVNEIEEPAEASAVLQFFAWLALVAGTPALASDIGNKNTCNFLCTGYAMRLCVPVIWVSRAYSSRENSLPTKMENSQFIIGSLPVSRTPGVRRCASLFDLSAAACIIAMMGVGAAGARASCGDWLAHPNDSMIASKAGASSPDHSKVALSGKHDGSRRSPLSAPCRGPHCRKAPAPLSPSSPLSVDVRLDRLALVPHGGSSEPTACRFRSGHDADVQSLAGFPSRIEHPPRA